MKKGHLLLIEHFNGGTLVDILLPLEIESITEEVRILINRNKKIK